MGFRDDMTHSEFLTEYAKKGQTEPKYCNLYKSLSDGGFDTQIEFQDWYEQHTASGGCNTCPRWHK